MTLEQLYTQLYTAQAQLNTLQNTINDLQAQINTELENLKQSSNIAG